MRTRVNRRMQLCKFRQSINHLFGRYPDVREVLLLYRLLSDKKEPLSVKNVSFTALLSNCRHTHQSGVQHNCTLMTPKRNSQKNTSVTVILLNQQFWLASLNPAQGLINTLEMNRWTSIYKCTDSTEAGSLVLQIKPLPKWGFSMQRFIYMWMKWQNNLLYRP